MVRNLYVQAKTDFRKFFFSFDSQREGRTNPSFKYQFISPEDTTKYHKVKVILLTSYVDYDTAEIVFYKTSDRAIGYDLYMGALNNEYDSDQEFTIDQLLGIIIGQHGIEVDFSLHQLAMSLMFVEDGLYLYMVLAPKPSAITAEPFLSADKIVLPFDRLVTTFDKDLLLRAVKHLTEKKLDIESIADCANIVALAVDVFLEKVSYRELYGIVHPKLPKKD